MLKITIPGIESFDEKTEEFVISKEQILQLEHSLVSLSKWESKWCKSFLSNLDKTFEESVDYINCMTITQNVDPDIYKNITKENVLEVSNYINAPMTATTISDIDGKINREIITSEIIYYWMISLNIPFECQKWHLNRLITLIKVCNAKNKKPKNMSQKEILDRNRSLNDARRKALNTTG